MGKSNESHISEYHLHQHQPDKLSFAVFDLHTYINEHQPHTLKPHIHSYYQIIWFKKGKGKHFVDFKEYDVFENAIFFIAKNQVHYFDAGLNYEGVLIHFNETFLVHHETEVDFFLKRNLFNNPYQQPSCCLGEGMEATLNGYLEQIKHELNQPQAFAQDELLRTYLKAFLIQVQRRKNEWEQSQGVAAFQVDEKRVQLLHFINLIEDHYREGLSVNEYAKLMNISTRSLSDLTHDHLGKTPSLMIQERIVLEAKRLLMHSHLNINQIGYRLGFDDPSYFVKYFKKHTHSSPSEFRNALS